MPSQSLLARQLLVVTGKGGVGKSAVAGALGRVLAAAGRRVLVAEVDPRESLHQLLGRDPSGGAIVEAGPRLWFQNLQPLEVLDALVRERLRIGLLADRVLESPVYRHFAAGGPGFKEMAVLGQALRLLRGEVRGAPAVDQVVLDAPATGHGVSLLAAPGLVAGVLARGPVGAVAAEVAELVGDPGRTAVVIVTRAEEMPATEALELQATLAERLGRGGDLLVVNALYPPLPGGGGGAPDGDRLSDLWRRRRSLNERELARLQGAWQGPRVELPMLALERGPEMVAALAARLERALAGDGRKGR